MEGPPTNNRINFNWKGKYTYGSVFFRGTSINLYDEFGEFVNKAEVSFQRTSYDNNEIEDDDDEYNETSELEPEIMFWNDFTAFRVGKFRDLFMEYDSYEPALLFKLISKFNIHTLTQAEDLLYFTYDNEWNWLKINNPKEIGNDRLKKLYANEYTGKCYINTGLNNQIIFIDHYYEFIKELKLVEEIAKIHKVTFYWV